MNRYFIIVLLFMCNPILHAHGQGAPDTVTILSDELKLKGLLWRPAGEGPFPAVIFCHGSYATDDKRYDVVQQCSVLGNIFVKNGYIFFAVFRRGAGLSSTQGENSADLMEIAMKQKGQEERNKVQLHQLLTNDSKDINSGVAYLLKRKDVNRSQLAIIGHSYGGSLTLLVAKHQSNMKAVIVFCPAGYSWDRNPQLRAALSDVVKKIKSPVMSVHPQNDYSISSGETLDSVMDVTSHPHLLKIYPSYGQSATEGHNFLFLNPNMWEADVFEFLHQNLH